MPGIFVEVIFHEQSVQQISRKESFLAIVQLMLQTQNKRKTMNSEERFDIIEKLLEFGVDHVVNDILMMLDIADLAQFTQVNR
jgi:hypothetical protein